MLDETDSASTGTVTLRLASLIASHGRVLVVGLLLLSSVLFVGAGWLYTHPDTEDFSKQTHVQTVRATASTSAVVTGNSSLYERGTRLHGKRLYFLDTTPKLRLTQQIHVPSGTETTVTQRLILRYTATHEGTVFWSTNRTLTTTTTTSTGDTVSARATLNMTQVRQQLAVYQREVGSGATVSVSVRGVAHYETDRYTGTLRQPMSLSFGAEWYEVSAEPVSQTHDKTVTVVRVVSRRHAELVGGLGAIALVLVPLVYRASRRLRPRQEQLDRRLARAQFSDWISRGDVQAAMTDRRVELETLAALVDVAVDIDGRIIHDTDRGVYAVFDDEVTYLVEELDTDSESELTGSEA